MRPSSLHALLASLLLAVVGAAQSTTWIGARSSDWFDTGNWSNGVPDALTTAEIRNGLFQPALVSTAACLDLVVLAGLDLDLRGGVVQVFGSVDAQATVTGGGRIDMLGNGPRGTVTVAARQSLPGLRHAARRDITVLDATIRGNLDYAATATGRLLWRGTIDVGGDLLLRGPDVVQLSGGQADVVVGDDAELSCATTMTAPFATLRVHDDLTAGTSFQPTGGEIVMTGNVAHAVDIQSNRCALLRLAAGTTTLTYPGCLVGDIVTEPGASIASFGDCLDPLTRAVLRTTTPVAYGTLRVPFNGSTGSRMLTVEGFSFLDLDLEVCPLTIVGRLDVGHLWCKSSYVTGGPGDVLDVALWDLQNTGAFPVSAPGTVYIGSMNLAETSSFGAQGGTVVFKGGIITTEAVSVGADNCVIEGGTDNATTTFRFYQRSNGPRWTGVHFANLEIRSGGGLVIPEVGGSGPNPPGQLRVDNLTVRAGASYRDEVGCAVGTLVAEGTATLAMAGGPAWNILTGNLIVPAGGSAALIPSNQSPGEPLQLTGDLLVDGTLTWPPGASILHTGDGTIRGNLPPLRCTGSALTVQSATIAGDFTFTAGDLTGTPQSELVVTGDVDLQPQSMVTDPPDRIRCGGDWTSSAAFAPAAGEVRFDGSAAQTVAAPLLHELRVAAGSTASLVAVPTRVTGAVTVLGNLDGTLSIDRAVTLDGGGSGWAGDLVVQGVLNPGPNLLTVRDMTFGTLRVTLADVHLLGDVQIETFHLPQFTVLTGDAATDLVVDQLLIGSDIRYGGVRPQPGRIEIRQALRVGSSSSFGAQQGVVIFNGPTIVVTEQVLGSVGGNAQIVNGSQVTFGTSNLGSGSWTLEVVDGNATVVSGIGSRPFATGLNVHPGATFTATKPVLLGDVIADGSVTVPLGSRIASVRGAGTFATTADPGDQKLYLSGDFLFDGTTSWTLPSFVDVDGDCRLRGTFPYLEQHGGAATIEQVRASHDVLFRGTTLLDGTADGSSLLDVAGDLTLQTTAPITSPPDRIECAGNWASDGNFAPAATGVVAFDGSGAQAVALGTPPLHDLEVATGAVVALGDLRLTGTVRVDGTLNLSGTVLQAAGVEVTGPLGLPNVAAVDLIGGGVLSVPATSPLPAVRVLGGSIDAPLATIAGDLLQQPACASLALGDVDVGGDAVFLGGTITGSALAAIQDLTVGGDVRMQTQSPVTTPPARIEVQGDWTADDAFTPTAGLTVLAGATTAVDHTAGGTCQFFDLTFASGTTTPLDRMEAKGPICRIAPGATVDMGTRRLVLAPGSTTTIEGELRLDQAGSLLGLLGSEIRFLPGSTLRARGRPSNHAKLIGVVSGFELGGHIDANNLTIDGLDARGVRILDSATFAAAPFDMRGVRIVTGSTQPGARMVDVARASGQTLELWDWELVDNAPTTYGVASTGLGRIDLINFGGGRGSQAYELDPNDVLFWSDRRTELAVAEASGGFLVNRVRFTTTREIAAKRFRFSRSTQPDGPWTVLQAVTAQGGGSTGASYAHADNAVLAGETWYYLVEEELLHDAWRPLFTDRARVFPATVGATAFVGPGAFGSIDAAIAAVPDGGTVVVAAGTWAPFAVGKPVHLLAFPGGGGPVRVVGGSPTVIGALPPGAGEVSIQGFHFGDGATPGGSELLRVEDAAHVVLLDEVTFTTAPGQDALRLLRAPQVKLQRVVADGRVALDAAVAYAANGAFAALDLRNASRAVHAATDPGTVTRDGSSVVSPLPGGAIRLECDAVWQAGNGADLAITGSPLHLFGVLLGRQLTFQDLSAALPLDMVLMLPVPIALLQGALPADGQVALRLPVVDDDALAGIDLALQVWSIDLGTLRGRFGTARHFVIAP